MENRKALIEQCLQEMLTTKEIGKRLGGLSRQRVYQLMVQYGLSTPDRKRRNYWKNQTDEMRWLSRTLNSKGINAKVKDEIVSELENNLPKVCPILGIELVYGNLDYRKDNSASIDRYDSNKPYEKGNINVISWRANRIKNDGTAEEHRKISEWMDKNI